MMELEREARRRRRMDTQTMRLTWAVFCAFAFAFAGVCASVAGCPLRVDPPTEDACGSRPNCGLCSSMPVCVWCPGAGEDGSCVGRSTTTCDVETVISVPEMCPGAVPEGAE